MPLSDLQKHFFQYILDGNADFQSSVQGDQVAQRLAIYADGYRLRLLEALADSYPNLKRWIGDDRFDSIGREYIAKFPSHHFSIRYFGHQLSDFLSVHEQYGKHLELAELAHFEWCLREVFDAADAPALKLTDLEKLSQEQWPSLIIQFHPSVHQVQYQFNTPTVWNALQEDKEPELSKLSEPLPWLVWRHELKTLFRSLKPHEYLCYANVLSGGTFEAMCERLGEDFPENAAYLAASFLRNGIEEGLFSQTFACQPN